MAAKPCRTCGGLGGAHYAFCFGARLIERVLGKRYPLFPPGTFVPALGSTPRPAEGGRVEVTLAPEPRAEVDEDAQVLAGTVAELRETLRRERASLLAQREESARAERERDELRALLEAATAPERAERGELDALAGEFDSTPEPWWWGSAQQEARASVALDSEAHVGEPMPTLQELAALPAEPAAEQVPTTALSQAEVEALEEAAAELEAAQDPAEIDEVEAAVATAGDRRSRIDELRSQVRELMASTPGLTQKSLAEGIGLNSGTVSQILGGKAYGPSALGHLQRMRDVARNHAGVETITRRGTLPAIRSGESWAAAELFLAETTERVAGAWTGAPELQAAYEEWRNRHEMPALHPTTLGQAAVYTGYARERRTFEGRQVRGYGHLKLRALATAGAPTESRSGGDEAPQDSDGEPVAGAPASPERVPLHPDAEKYTRDETDVLLDRIEQSGGSIKGVLSTWLAHETAMGPALATIHPATDPATYVRPPARPVVTIEHPAGWDDIPGRELQDQQIRKMATVLRKEQGWGYRKSHGRQGKPKLRNPQGHTYTLPNTPSDYRSSRNARAGLRRLGADL